MKTFRSFKEMIEWLSTHYNTPLSQEECVEKILWFVAVQEARTCLDAFSTKDMANMLLDGCQKIDESYVENWLQTMYEDLIDNVFVHSLSELPPTISEETADESGVDDIEQNLKDFFNI